MAARALVRKQRRTNEQLAFPISCFYSVKDPVHWRYHPYSGSILLFGNPVIEEPPQFFSFLGSKDSQLDGED